MPSFAETIKALTASDVKPKEYPIALEELFPGFKELSKRDQFAAIIEVQNEAPSGGPSFAERIGPNTKQAFESSIELARRGRSELGTAFSGAENETNPLISAGKVAAGSIGSALSPAIGAFQTGAESLSDTLRGSIADIDLGKIPGTDVQFNPADFIAGVAEVAPTAFTPGGIAKGAGLARRGLRSLTERTVPTIPKGARMAFPAGKRPEIGRPVTPPTATPILTPPSAQVLLAELAKGGHKPAAISSRRALKTLEEITGHKISPKLVDAQTEASTMGRLALDVKRESGLIDEGLFDSLSATELASSLARQGKGFRFVWDRIGKEASRTLNSYGKAGQRLSSLLKRSRDDAAVEIGQFTVRLQQVLAPLGQRELRNLVDVLDHPFTRLGTATKPVNKKVAAAAENLKAWTTSIALRAERIGLKIRDPITGENTPFVYGKSTKVSTDGVF